MTEKLLTFPSLLPPPPLLLPPQTLGMGSIGQNSTFFPEQHQHKPTIKTFVQGQHARIQGFFVRWGGGGGGGGGGGVQAPQLILQFTEGVQWLYYTFSFFQGGGGGGGGVQLLISIETHMTITLDFPGGSGPPIPPLDPHMDNVAFLYKYAQTSLCGILLSLETSNANRLIVLSD